MEAGRESPAANEFDGPGSLLDGDCWKCCLLYGDTQEEHAWNLMPKRNDVDDYRASCDAASTRAIRTHSSSCCTMWTRRCSTGNRQSCHSPKFRKTRRVSSMSKSLDVRRNSLEFVLQQMHTALMALTSYEANDIVANTRKNPLEAWRRLQKRFDPTTGGRKRKPSAHDHVSGTVLSSGTPSGDRTLGVLRVSLREEDEG